MKIRTKIFLQTLLPVFFITSVGLIAALRITVSQHNEMVNHALTSNLNALKLELDQLALEQKKILEDEFQSPNLEVRSIVATIDSLYSIPDVMSELKHTAQCQVIYSLQEIVKNHNLDQISLYQNGKISASATENEIFVTEYGMNTPEYLKQSPGSILFECASKEWVKSEEPEIDLLPVIREPQSFKQKFITVHDKLYLEGMLPVQTKIYLAGGEERRTAGVIVVRKEISNEFLSSFSKKEREPVDVFLPSGVLTAGNHFGELKESPVSLDMVEENETYMTDVAFSGERFYLLMTPFVFGDEPVAYLATYTSMDMVVKNINRVVYLHLLVLAIALAAATAVTIYSSARITGPMAMISEQMDDISVKKTFDKTISIDAKDELGVLANSFNHMIAIIKQHQDEKEKSISELAEINEKLAESEKKYRAIFNNSIEGLFQVSTSGTFISANPAVANILGYKAPRDLIGAVDNLASRYFLHDSEWKLLRGTLKSNGIVANFETQLRKKDGRVFWGAVSVSEVRNEEGELEYYDGLLVDVTERKEREKAVKKQRFAEAANKAKSEFLANMSHEIRTPLNVIIGMAELIMESDLDSVQLERMKMLHKSSEILLSLINDVLDISKIEAGKIDLEKTGFNLEDHIGAVMSLMGVKAGEKGLDLKFNIEEGVPSWIYGDPFRLRQVIINLVNNSVKFTDEGRITLNVKPGDVNDETVELIFSVSDTGIGIPQDRIDTLFEAFTQADNSITRKYGGSGLGLAISKKLVELMGGTIKVDSEIGKNSTFSFNAIFKRVSSKVIEEKESERAKLAEGVTIKPIEKPVEILVVEDNKMNQSLVMELLGQFGLTADIADNGKIAIRKMLEKSYDLVLMDVHMPEMDGYETTQSIRDANSGVLSKDAPIIAMTADVVDKVKQKCIDAGMNDYISKPLSKVNLYIAIKRQLRELLGDNGEGDYSVLMNSALDIKIPEKKPREVLAPELAKLKVLDLDQLKENIGERGSLLKMMLDAFAEDLDANIKDRISQIKKAVKDGDATTLREGAHYIKGGALNVFASRLAAVAEALQSIAEQTEVKSAIPLLVILEQEYESVKEHLKKLKLS